MAIASRSQRPAAMSFFSFRGGWAQLTMSSFSFRGAGPSCGHVISFFPWGGLPGQTPPEARNIKKSKDLQAFLRFLCSTVHPTTIWPPGWPAMSSFSFRGAGRGWPCHLFYFAGTGLGWPCHLFLFAAKYNDMAVSLFFVIPNIMTWPCHRL